MSAVSRQHRGSGFTLVELMVVIVILGMVAGIVSVSWQSMLPKQRLNSDVRTLSSRLRSARSDAIARNAEFRIRYHIDENRYWIRSPYTVNGERAVLEEDYQILSETEMSSGIDIESVTVDGKTYTDGEVFISFDPLGKSSEHRVVLYQELFDRRFTIEVLALTGLIKFHDGEFIREEATDLDFD